MVHKWVSKDPPVRDSAQSTESTKPPVLQQAGARGSDSAAGIGIARIDHVQHIVRGRFGDRAGDET